MGKGAGQWKRVAREEVKAFSLCDQEEDSTGKPGEQYRATSVGGRLGVSSIEPHVCGRRHLAPKCPSF